MAVRLPAVTERQAVTAGAVAATAITTITTIIPTVTGRTRRRAVVAAALPVADFQEEEHRVAAALTVVDAVDNL